MFCYRFDFIYTQLIKYVNKTKSIIISLNVCGSSTW